LHIQTDGLEGADGYVLFALLGAAYMLLVVTVNVVTDVLDLARRHVGPWQTARLRALPVLSVSGAFGAFVATSTLAAPDIVAAAQWTVLPRQIVIETGAAHAYEILRAAAVDPAPSDAPPQPEVVLPLPPTPEIDSHFSVGAFDPWQRLGDPSQTIEHWFVPQNDPQLLAGALAHAGQHTLMVTVEPTASVDDSTPVLQRIASGLADDELLRLASVVRDAPSGQVLIRWAHEMDLTLLYPWSGTDPALYRAAYRHVVDVFRQAGATNVRWVWSPAGEARSLAFYPGDDVVDYVGLTVLGDAAWDAELGYTPRQSMADILRPRYTALEVLGKPMVIAELGVSGSPAEQRDWLAAAARALPDFPLVHAVVYYDDTNAPNNWRGTQPDWRLTDRSALDPLLQLTRWTSLAYAKG
jgi:hypothetical protein